MAKRLVLCLIFKRFSLNTAYMWLFCVVTLHVGDFASGILDFNGLWNSSAVARQITTNQIQQTRAAVFSW